MQHGVIPNKEIIVLDRGDYTSCTVNLHGATLTSWRINNKEMIFVSRESHFSNLSHIRGGIQFVFPVFGEWDLGPRHGFARCIPWTLTSGPDKLEDGNVCAMITLKSNAYTRSLWAFDFKLYYKITLHETKIVFDLGVENIGNSPIEFQIMQHSLMRVPDVTKCEIIGFHNCKYRDLLRENKVFTEDRLKVTIRGRTDRMYINAPKEITITNTMNGGNLKLTKTRTRDINLWNPWIEQSIQVRDLGNDEYTKFIAVEAGEVSRTMRLHPLCCWQAHQTFEYIKPKEEKIIEDYYDIFKGYC